MRIELFGQALLRARQLDCPLGTEVLFRMQGEDHQVSPLDYLNSLPGGAMSWYMDATVMGSLLVSDSHRLQGLLFINLCAETLAQDFAFMAWLEGLRELCNRRAPNQVVVEISERCSLETKLLQNRLDSIICCGALLALDDYPDGVESARLLRAYRWDFVKICRFACDRLGRVLESVIDDVTIAQPQALIIGERFRSEQVQRLSQDSRLAAFQSFELGLPEPLIMQPYNLRQKGVFDENDLCGNWHCDRRLAGA